MSYCLSCYFSQLLRLLSIKGKMYLLMYSDTQYNKLLIRAHHEHIGNRQLVPVLIWLIISDEVVCSKEEKCSRRFSCELIEACRASSIL